MITLFIYFFVFNNKTYLNKISLIFTMQKKVGLKSTILLITVTFTLVTILSDSLTGNASYIAPGKIESKSKFYIDKGHYFSPVGQSQCDKVGGISLGIGSPGKLIKDRLVKVVSVADDTTLVSIHGAKKAMDIGNEEYIAGLYVTVFATSENDACLILRDYQ
ncbi:MAG: hypothetical protein CMH62_01710 [Nanoarchaeota archaeon]|nr:hypothetical protein [Nanoarchaeota archaeon]|tara:strand:- start:145 stop:630 length:486 start_codon:yes stop_codon:yes gene_type:complete